MSHSIASGIQPIQNLSVLKKVGDEKKAEWGNYWINKGFQSEFNSIAYNAPSIYVQVITV